MRARHVFTLMYVLVFGSSCASQEKRFENIYPGMSMDAVRQQMEDGPSRFEDISNTNYSAWYWENKYCVLFREEIVVAKDSSKVQTPIQFGPARIEENRSAQCLPPGYVVQSETSRTINIPGLGTVTIPQTLPAPTEPSREPATPEFEVPEPKDPEVGVPPEAVLPNIPEEAPQAPQVERDDTY